MVDDGRWRVAHGGGNANNGDNAGFATLNANNDSSNRNANVGSQLCLKIETPSYTVPLGKRKNVDNGVSRACPKAPKTSKA